jgi:alanine-synthesizing transaminase
LRRDCARGGRLLSRSVFSKRTEWELSPNALARALASRRAAGGSVVDLTTTNPTEVGLRHSVSFFAELSDPSAASYEPQPLGLESAREAVAEYYRARGSACDPQAVWLCASTSEAFAWLLALLCDPGDAVLVPRPGYPLLDYLASLAGVRLVHYPLRWDGAWHVDRSELVRIARSTAGARAIVATSPGNPTGAVLSAEELRTLEAVCAELGIAAVVDEVFADYPLDPAAAPFPSALGERECLCFVLSGVSKVAALPQWKLGWGVTCGPAELRRRAEERLVLVADTFLSVSTPAQLALPRILRAAPAMQARIRARVAGNLGALRSALGGSAASVRAGAGGWAAVVRLPEFGERHDESWALALLERGVLTHPGGFYDLDGCAVVVSLLPEPEAFARGAAAIARALAEL